VVEEHILVQRAREGDAEAFRELVERSMRIIYRLSFDLTGNRQDAEDLSQEVFVKAQRSLRNFRGSAKWTTWLYRITVNTSIDMKKSNKYSSVEYDDGIETAGRDARASHRPAGPDRLTDGVMIQEQIEKALGRLSPNERSVFVLRHYHDLPLRQIAETLDVAEGTVKSHLFRAVQRLQKELLMYKKDFGLEEA
jgi:RNA polymerase sigma-70 factor (ECF subfamily)